MRKTTAPQQPSRRKVQRANPSTGLIVEANTAQRSAGTECAIDNRSHRTPKFTSGRSLDQRSTTLEADDSRRARLMMPLSARWCNARYGAHPAMPTTSLCPS